MSAKDAPIAYRFPLVVSVPRGAAPYAGFVHWAARADYIAQRADLVRNFDRWLQLRAAAEMWERQYGGS